MPWGVLLPTMSMTAKALSLTLSVRRLQSLPGCCLSGSLDVTLPNTGIAGKNKKEVRESCISDQRSWDRLRQSGKSINRVWGRMKAQAESGHICCFLFPDSVSGFPNWGLSPGAGLLAITPWGGAVHCSGRTSDQSRDLSSHPSSLLAYLLWPLWASVYLSPSLGPHGILNRHEFICPRVIILLPSQPDESDASV